MTAPPLLPATGSASHRRPRRRPVRNLWFERVMATIAVINLGLVMFDLTYVKWRNFWLQGNIVVPFTELKLYVPLPVVDCPDRSLEPDAPPRTLRQSAITCGYDVVKGIEPHRDTQAYLNTVRNLEQQVSQKGMEVGLRSPEVQTTLGSLRKLSSDMIDTNPFELAGKSGTLEKIKRQMRDHIGNQTGRRLSSRESFNLFWSDRYLTPQNWNRELAWFNSTITPLMETNYYRSTGENGLFTDYFWLIDAPFVTLFALEFLARTYYLSRRHKGLRWLDAMFWRWYDVPLFLPFSLFAPVLALSRAFPTAIRLHQAQLINLDELQAQIRWGFAANIAEEVGEVFILQGLNQVQGMVRRGELDNLLNLTRPKRYVDINNTNEIEAIASNLLNLTVNHVFPKIQPDLEAVLRQSIHSVLSQSPAYRSLHALPGIGALPVQITERLVADVTQLLYKSVQAIVADPKVTKLALELVNNLNNTMFSEIQQQETLQELQALLVDLIEEVKINYIQRTPEENIDSVLDEARQIQRLPR
jgi:hypothetical protein